MCVVRGDICRSEMRGERCKMGGEKCMVRREMCLERGAWK